VDTLLVDRGLAETRAKAQALVLAGQVRSGEKPLAKPGFMIDETVPLEVERGPRYVSRGGEKLEHALHAFNLDVTGLTAADVGSSTGGFTDCLLQHGASRVVAIDVGKAQLDYRLRNDARVVVMEETNVRGLDSLPKPVDVITIDVSFISLRLVLPVVAAWLGDAWRRGAATHALANGAASDIDSMQVNEHKGCCAPTTSAAGSIVALFKPQFEAEKAETPRGGVIRDPLLHSTLIGRFASWSTKNGFRILDLTASPILGAEGNREFLFWLQPTAVRQP
jgi:23S rRNA (cytidine1920-2'-O)/16S rRNA (cytidine1409-2'-O)-methyltransferase